MPAILARAALIARAIGGVGGEDGRAEEDGAIGWMEPATGVGRAGLADLKDTIYRETGNALGRIVLVVTEHGHIHFVVGRRLGTVFGDRCGLENDVASAGAEVGFAGFEEHVVAGQLNDVGEDGRFEVSVVWLSGERGGEYGEGQEHLLSPSWCTGSLESADVR